MVIIYCCYGGAHSSVTAAAIHLGMLDPAVRPPARRVMDLPSFDRARPSDHGHLQYWGEDRSGDRVYTVGCRGFRPILRRAMRGLLEIFGLDPEDVLLVDTLTTANWAMRVGGFLSRRWGIVRLGRPLVAWGAARAFPALVAVVGEAKRRVAQRRPRTAAVRRPGPKVVYHCYGSAHSSVVSASIHLGKLPARRVPTGEEITSLTLFDRVMGRQIGTPFFMGKDGAGREVYALGLGPGKDIIKRTLEDLLAVYRIPARWLVMGDSLPRIGVMTRVGGFLSRRLGWVSVGRRLAALGIRRDYFGLVNLVRDVLRRLTDEPFAAGPAEGQPTQARP